jgi:CheY-like chemotaxis protein
MSLPGWALPTFAAAIVGLGLFGAYSYFDYSYVETNTRSASRPVVPILLSKDKGSSQAQQSSEASTPTSLTGHARLPSSEGTALSADPWASEALEAALGEPITTESNELDGAVEGSDFPRGVSGERASGTEGSAPLEGESSSLESVESVSPESTTASPRDPTQSSADPNTGALPQEAPASTPPSDPPMSIQTPSPPSPPSAGDALLPRDGDAGTGRANAKLKQVLLVEDPRVLGENLAMALKREPDLAVVGQTGSPADCGNFVSTEGEVDVAIVALLLPDAQGISLIEGLHRTCPHVPLLVLTTSLDPADQERLMKAGANAVLAKDADPEEIAFIVRRLSPS